MNNSKFNMMPPKSGDPIDHELIAAIVRTVKGRAFPDDRFAFDTGDGTHRRTFERAKDKWFPAERLSGETGSDISLYSIVQIYDASVDTEGQLTLGVANGRYSGATSGQESYSPTQRLMYGVNEGYDILGSGGGFIKPVMPGNIYKIRYSNAGTPPFGLEFRPNFDTEGALSGALVADSASVASGASGRGVLKFLFIADAPTHLDPTDEATIGKVGYFAASHHSDLKLVRVRLGRYDIYRGSGAKECMVLPEYIYNGSPLVDLDSTGDLFYHPGFSLVTVDPDPLFNGYAFGYGAATNDLEVDLVTPEANWYQLLQFADVVEALSIEGNLYAIGTGRSSAVFRMKETLRTAVADKDAYREGCHPGTAIPTSPVAKYHINGTGPFRGIVIGLDDYSGGSPENFIEAAVHAIWTGDRWEAAGGRTFLRAEKLSDTSADNISIPADVSAALTVNVEDLSEVDSGEVDLIWFEDQTWGRLAGGGDPGCGLKEGVGGAIDFYAAYVAGTGLDPEGDCKLRVEQSILDDIYELQEAVSDLTDTVTGILSTLADHEGRIYDNEVCCYENTKAIYECCRGKTEVDVVYAVTCDAYGNLTVSTTCVLVQACPPPTTTAPPTTT